MAKMWAGRTSGDTDSLADEFNSSIAVDQRMYAQDIEGSIAHAAMLASCGIITESDAQDIIGGLRGILADIESGALSIDPAAEDIHMFVEEVLTKRIGESGKKLHTARSRNDQVALDLRMYLRDEAAEISSLLRELIRTLTLSAEKYTDVVMPGYTHLQRAQPVLFSHHLMAYCMMFLRDLGRLKDCSQRMNVSPIGACALAGTSFPTDRGFEASELGFDSVGMNSLDCVSDRDFCLEFMSALSIVMMHLSRLSEELVLWSGWEFRFIELSDEFTTGSSIMPQKKNPDMAELIRGKTGRVYGDLMGLLTVMKGLPLAYNKDMQEDKEAVFDAADSVKLCLRVASPMIAGMKVLSGNMLRAAKEGFINATDLADYLTAKGLPFRSAYKISGEIVNDCIGRGLVLEDYPLALYREKSELIDEDIYGFIDIANCVNKRSSEGGTALERVLEEIDKVKEMLK